MMNQFLLLFPPVLSILFVSLVQSEAATDTTSLRGHSGTGNVIAFGAREELQSVSPSQTSPTVPALKPSATTTASGSGFFSPDFYAYLRSGNFSTEGLNPDPTPSAWVGLGDSFAAGPGAGDEIQDGANCVRGTLNYPLQMQADNEMPGPNGPNGPKPAFVLKACTGDVTTDVTNPSNPNYQLGAVGSGTSFVTLSIGGNDILFSTILKKCVFGIGVGVIGGPDCDTLLSNSRDLLYGQGFYENYNAIIIGILSNMDWENRYPIQTAIYQTSYSQFFDTYTDQCDGASFYRIGFVGPKITKDLRTKLNTLAHEVNYVLSYYSDLLNVQYSHESGNPSVLTAAVSFVDVDIGYSEHRFCREGVNEPEFDNPETYFFHLNVLQTADNETVAVGNPNMTVPQENATASWIDAHYGDGVNAALAPLWVTKTFHPTSAGFTRTKEIIIGSKLFFQNGMRHWATTNRDLYLWVVGDYIAYASQDPTSAIYQGIIPHLKAILRNDRYYGWPWGTARGVLPIFSGSQDPGYANSELHECYKSASIDQLHANFVASSEFHFPSKVILLMAGTIDVLYEIDLDNWPNRYASLIHAIFATDPDAKVFAAHIPMIGVDLPDPFRWYALQQRVSQFNARLNGLVDQLATQYNYKIMTVHTSATTKEHLDGDLLLPSTKGYLRIALNFVENMALAAERGWFDPPPIIGVPSTIGMNGAGNQLPTRPGNNNTLVLNNVTCTQEFQYFAGQGMVTAEENFNSIRRNLPTEDFITKVACNVSEICKWATDGVHGNTTDFPSFNGTVCVTAGGTLDKADYNQLTIVRPNGSYDLGNSNCKDAVESILSNCILSGKYYGGYFKGKDGLYIEQTNLNFPRNPTDQSPFAIANIPNNIVEAALDGPAPTTTTFTPATPFAAVTGIYA